MSPPDFDPVAGVYAGLQRLVFGERLRKAESAFLDRIPADSRIAIVGGGSGEILLSLAAADIRPREILFIDASAKMVKKAQRLLHGGELDKGFAESVRLQAAAIDGRFSHGDCDVLITPFFLDCFEGDSLDRIISLLASGLGNGSLWLLTDFAHPAPRPWHQRLLLAAMFLFFRLTCAIESRRLQDYRSRIIDHGFVELDSLNTSTPAGPVLSVILQRRES